MAYSAEGKSHYIWGKHFSILVDNVFIELPGSKLEILGKARTFNFSAHLNKEVRYKHAT